MLSVSIFLCNVFHCMSAVRYFKFLFIILFYSFVAANNKTTGNFTTLVCVSIYHIREMVTNKERLKEEGCVAINFIFKMLYK